VRREPETSTWRAKFEAAFDAIAPNLAVVLNATGCRELWFHGELYRHLGVEDADFVVNAYSMAPRKTADLRGSKPGPMITEVKVFGVNGYYNKNLEGWSNIDLYRPRDGSDRIDVSETHLSRVNPKVDSLLRDYQRLREHQANGVEKYLILVLHLNGEPDVFGKAVSAIRVSSDELTFSYPTLMVRIWSV
jgi:hypothetical protein